MSQNGSTVAENELLKNNTVSSEDDTITAFNENAKEPTIEEDMVKKQINDLMERFHSKHNIKIRSLEERVKEIQKIQRESLNYLLQMLFGKKASSPKQLSSLTNINEDMSNTALSANSNSDSATPQSSIGGTYEDFYYYEEHETTCFDTKGTVVTADGRNISFDISLEMSRSFTEMASTQIDFGEPRLCDPLVINLNTNIASVSDQKFFFDLDSDGEKEEVSMLNPNSGYLSLDKNNDGLINNGSELFGTESGNGFQDLKQYDLDENGWIDEADEIFQKLKIWTMDENGNSKLMNLKDAGVGAIYLGHKTTDFSLTDANNHVNAKIRKTGIFLYENGYSGTIQQLDLAT